MVAEPCVDAEMAHDDEDEIEKQMGSGVDRAERRKHDETDHESKSYVDRAERRKHDETVIEQKERTKAYEQQAADAREYTIMLEAELQRIYARILALMDENLIPSASTGEPNRTCHWRCQEASADDTEGAEDCRSSTDALQ